jgi:hypothetical protein
MSAEHAVPRWTATSFDMTGLTYLDASEQKETQLFTRSHLHDS